MSKKRVKRIDPQNSAQAGPEGTQRALHIKHFYLYCMEPESLAIENNFFGLAAFQASDSCRVFLVGKGS